MDRSQTACLCWPDLNSFDLLTLNVVSESRVTWATSVPTLVFLGLSILDLGPIYATDVRRRQTDRRQTSDTHHRLIPQPRGRRHNNFYFSCVAVTLCNLEQPKKSGNRSMIARCHLIGSQTPWKFRIDIFPCSNPFQGRIKYVLHNVRNSNCLHLLPTKLVVTNLLS